MLRLYASVGERAVTIIDESPETLRRSKGIVPLTPPCRHRDSDGSSAWFEESIVMGRGRCGSRWVCSLCGAGDWSQETFEQAVGECVDDR